MMSRAALHPPHIHPHGAGVVDESAPPGWGRASLEDVIGLAATKNSEFTRNPRRSNSLVQTLLQRRHWFHLLAMHDEREVVPPPSTHSPPLVLAKKDRLCPPPGPSRKRPSPVTTPTTTPSDPHADGGDCNNTASIVLVLELDATQKVVAKKRRVSVVSTVEREACAVEGSR